MGQFGIGDPSAEDGAGDIGGCVWVRGREERLLGGQTGPLELGFCSAERREVASFVDEHSLPLL